MSLILVSSIRMSSEVDFVEAEMARLRAYAMCVSGNEYLRNRLITGFPGNNEFLDGEQQPFLPRLLVDGRNIEIRFSDIIDDSYLKKLPEMDTDALGFQLSLQDSSGLINFFKTDKVLLKQLMAHNGIEAKHADIIIHSIYDWMDNDDFTRPSGAESDYYLKAPNNQTGYTAANRLIDSREELLLVRGMDKETYAAIGHLLDFGLQSQGINPNTMPPDAFYLFRGIKESSISQVVEKRAERFIEGPAQLDMISGYSFSSYPNTFQFFTSNTTYVTIKSQMNEERNFYIMFKMKRKSGGGSMRRGRSQTDPLSAGKHAVDGFAHYFDTTYRQQGTERISDQYYGN
ncbi:MAG: general secretion pathway protein GspK [bacterium]|nr:general secretion pathway protein GspK [bacterium]